MKPIPGYPNYKVTKAGKVYSFQWGKKRLLKRYKHTSGYPVAIMLYDAFRNRKSFYVHKLVAMVYMPNFDPKKRVLFKDDNINNIHIDNLYQDVLYKDHIKKHGVRRKGHERKIKLRDGQFTFLHKRKRYFFENYFMAKTVLAVLINNDHEVQTMFPIETPKVPDLMRLANTDLVKNAGLQDYILELKLKQDINN